MYVQFFLYRTTPQVLSVRRGKSCGNKLFFSPSCRAPVSNMLDGSSLFCVLFSSSFFYFSLGLVALKVGPLSLRRLLLEGLPTAGREEKNDQLPQHDKEFWGGGEGGGGTYTLAFFIMPMSLSSFSAVRTTSSMRPAPILFSTSSILRGQHHHPLAHASCVWKPPGFRSLSHSFSLCL